MKRVAGKNPGMLLVYVRYYYHGEGMAANLSTSSESEFTVEEALKGYRCS
ncbi:MAG: hypothetical protein ACLVE3_01405 [[Clostridium] scindens]